MAWHSVMWSRCVVPSGVPRCTPVFHGGGAGVHSAVECTPVFHVEVQESALHVG